MQYIKSLYKRKVKTSAADLILYNLKKEIGKGVWVTEHKFNVNRRWRFDFAHLPTKTAVEIHGGIYTNGRHVRSQGFTNDREKMNNAQLLGWLVLEFTGEQVTKKWDSVWQQINLAIDLRR